MIKAIQDQVRAIISGLVEIRATYTYPIADLGRQLPALLVLYDGFSQTRISRNRHDTLWRFELSLYLPAEGKRLDIAWSEVLSLVPVILQVFRGNPTLNDSCRTSTVASGEPVIHTPAPGTPTQYIGHTFKLEAVVDTD